MHSFINVIAVYRELVEGDKANREKKRLAEEKRLSMKMRKEKERKRIEEGYCFDSEYFEPEEQVDNETLLPDSFNDTKKISTA